jgi:hypothetical protein
MPASANQAKIHALLDELERSNHERGSRSYESRNIRRELRALGHRGGLRTRPAKNTNA